MDEKHPIGDEKLAAVSGGSGLSEGDNAEYICASCERTFPKSSAVVTVYHDSSGVQGTKLHCPYCFSASVLPTSWGS